MWCCSNRPSSPWRSPGAKAPSTRASPRVARPPGFETHLLEPEDLAWESPTSARHSSSAHPSCLNYSSTDHQAAPKEAADPSSGPQSGDGSVLGSPDQAQGGSDRQGKGLSSYPLDFSGKADALQRLTEQDRTKSSRSKGTAKVSVGLLAAFLWTEHMMELAGGSAFPAVLCETLCYQFNNQARWRPIGFFGVRNSTLVRTHSLSCVYALDPQGKYQQVLKCGMNSPECQRIDRSMCS